MRDWLAETWVVLLCSTKTQLALAFGLIFFVGILAMGDMLVARLALHGPLAPLADVIRDRLMDRYEKAAWVALIGFIVVAIKAYRKDRRRLLGI